MLRGLLGCEVVFLAPGGTELFRSNVNVTVQPMPTDGDLRHEIERQVAQMPAHLTDYKKLDQQEIDFAGRHTLWVAGSYRHGTTTVRVEQWFIATIGRIVAVSGSWPDEKTAAVRPLIERLVDELRITEE